MSGAKDAIRDFDRAAEGAASGLQTFATPFISAPTSAVEHNPLEQMPGRGADPSAAGAGAEKTVAEKGEERRQRNRLSAQLSRQRARQYTLNLETRVHDLEARLASFEGGAKGGGKGGGGAGVLPSRPSKSVSVQTDAEESVARTRRGVTSVHSMIGSQDKGVQGSEISGRRVEMSSDDDVAARAEPWEKAPKEDTARGHRNFSRRGGTSVVSRDGEADIASGGVSWVHDLSPESVPGERDSASDTDTSRAELAKSLLKLSSNEKPGGGSGGSGATLSPHVTLPHGDSPPHVFHLDGMGRRGEARSEATEPGSRRRDSAAPPPHKKARHA